MDGYAVRAGDVAAADEAHPVRLRVVAVAEAGRPAGAVLAPGEAVEIATGAPLPAGANAVVPVERTDAAGDAVLVRRGVAPGENLMGAGEDLMVGDVALPAGTFLGPAQLATLAALGLEEVAVLARPVVAIASLGDEIRPAGAGLEPGQIHDVNGAFLDAAVRRAGGRPRPLGILPDDRGTIEASLLAAARDGCALLLTSGSTSAGAGDVVYRVLEERGELLAHGVRVEPGKPTVLGRLAGVPFLGLPGNPGSAAVIFETLAAPLIRSAAGLDPHPPRARIRAELASELRGAPGRRLLRMVGVVRRGEGYRAYPVEKRSGAITLLALADGFVDVPEDRARVPAGAEVEVALLEDRGSLPDALFVGSHCLGLAPLFAALAPLRARSANAGSLGAIRAVSGGLADAGGLHLREPGGGYNAPVLARMQVRGVVLLRGWTRIQGWIVPPGNPRAVGGMADLLDAGLRIVNRTPSSGTRVLLDELLAGEALRRGADAGALARRLPGYDVEASTHGAVAAAVGGGLADAGLGIEAAAALAGLGFVPVAEERYDLLVRGPDLESPFGRALREALASSAFQEALSRLPGYRADPGAGEVIWRSPPAPSLADAVPAAS
jgi:putative molybdopterin biosynthesis protein